MKLKRRLGDIVGTHLEASTTEKHLIAGRRPVVTEEKLIVTLAFRGVVTRVGLCLQAAVTAPSFACAIRFVEDQIGPLNSRLAVGDINSDWQLTPLGVRGGVVSCITGWGLPYPAVVPGGQRDRAVDRLRTRGLVDFAIAVIVQTIAGLCLRRKWLQRSWVSVRTAAYRLWWAGWSSPTFVDTAA